MKRRMTDVLKEVSRRLPGGCQWIKTNKGHVRDQKERTGGSHGQ